MMPPEAPVKAEALLTENRSDEWWKKSRQAVNRLFEGYFKDYGPEEGGKIVKAIIDVLGSSRLTIPEKLPNNPDNTEALLALYACLCDRFQQASGEAIMRKFIMELKGLRISFPDWDDIHREERNRKIRNAFKGNYTELSLRFGLDVSQIWRIVNEE